MAEINALDLLGAGTSTDDLLCPKDEDNEYIEEITVKQEIEPHDYGDGDSQLARVASEEDLSLGYVGGNQRAYYMEGVAAYLLMGDDEEEEEYNDEIKPGTSEQIDPFPPNLHCEKELKVFPEFSAENSRELEEAETVIPPEFAEANEDNAGSPYYEGDEAIPDEQGKDFQKCVECKRTVYYSSKRHEWSRKCEHLLFHIPAISFGCTRCPYKCKTKCDVFRHLRDKHGGVFYYPAVRNDSIDEHKIFISLLKDCFPGTPLKSLYLPYEPMKLVTITYYYIFIPNHERVKKWVINRLPELKVFQEKKKEAVLPVLKSKADRPDEPAEPGPRAKKRKKNQRNDRQNCRCTSCKTLISAGPLEWKLKCEHSMTHMGLKWLMCDLCPLSGFSSDDLFNAHVREMHPTERVIALRKKLVLSGEILVAVESLVQTFFPGSVKPESAEPAPQPPRPPAVIVIKANSPITLSDLTAPYKEVQSGVVELDGD